MKNILKILCGFLFLSQFIYADSFTQSINKARELDIEIPQPQKSEVKYEKNLSNLFSYFDNLFKTINIEGEDYFSLSKLSNKSALLYSIDLKKILNEYLKSPITFNTSRGNTVYVSASKSSNCPDLSNKCQDKEKFFMVLTTSDNEIFFIRAMEIINWSIFMSGSKAVIIDGEKYVVKIYAKASEPEKSVLQIEGSSGIVLKTTLDKIGKALATKAIDIKLSKSYKLAYGNEIVQTGNGNARFTKNKLLLFYPIDDSSTYYVIDVSRIKTEGTIFPSMEPDYIFSINREILEISKR